MKMKNNTFICKICKNEIFSKFLPSTKPSCPACGGDVEINNDAIGKNLVTLCQSCHTENILYESKYCKKCGDKSSYWSGEKNIAQDNTKPFENNRVLYKSSRGPEGGTIPRWENLNKLS